MKAIRVAYVSEELERIRSDSERLSVKIAQLARDIKKWFGP